MAPGTAQVTEINVSPVAGAPTRSVQQAEVVAGRGIIGDRYFDISGPEVGKPAKPRDVTIVGTERLVEASEVAGFEIVPADTRRNIAVSGVDVEALVGKQFTIGAITFEGTETCHPCAFLEELDGRPTMKPLMGRAGIRARALNDGTLHVGDAVELT